MALVLDKKDRRILYELDKDARLSCARVGKRIGLSTEVVHYRLKRLLGQGIVTKFQTTVDYARMGLIHFKICVGFDGISLKDEESYYSRIQDMDNVVWIAKCGGEWDCMVSCTVRSISELDSVKDAVLAAGSGLIREKSISISDRIWSFPRNYLVGSDDEGSPRAISGPIELDGIDLSLLRSLSKDARIPVIDLAKLCAISISQATYRLKRLKDSGTIKNFRLVIGYERSGISFFKTLVYLKYPEKARLQAMLTHLNRHPNVIHNMKVIGDWDLEPEFEFEDPLQFQATMQVLKDKFPDVIRKVSVVTVQKEYKYTFFYK
jgi:Lrp/AsnC family transcriptional regulator, leucine-responsive regulatory protein